MNKKPAKSKPKAAVRQPAKGCRRPSFCSGLAARWNDAQIEVANSLVNDIAEDIDNGETRETQRQVIATLADMLYDAHEARRSSLMEIGLLAFKHITDESPNV